MERLKEASFVSLVAVFAAINVVCDSFIWPFTNISGESSVWFSWIFMAESINGILLGPFAGFFSTLIGVMIGHSVYFRGSPEFLFTFGAPIGAMISSLIFRGKWKIVLIYYSALLGAYFVTPVSWQLPIWGMWNVYLAFCCLLILITIKTRWKGFLNAKSTGVRLLPLVVVCTFIGLEADVLFRIFVLVPCQAYHVIYRLDVAILQTWWAMGAVETSTKAALSTLITLIVAPPIIKAVRKMGLRLFEN